jgi:PAS domain S-box-containing protein
MDSGSISIAILGKINLLQSMVIHLNDNSKIVDAVCHEFEELPGVNSVKYTPASSMKEHTPCDPSGTTTLTIRHKSLSFGFFTLSVSDFPAFEVYLPFLQNFINMLGVIFEERRQRAVNDELREQLELRVLQRTEELYEQTENLRITFNSIGDAILVTDITGKITAINPVAEKLTGWCRDDAIGQSAADVFKIINANSRQRVASPIDQVLVNGKKVNLANHTILISRGGQEYQIADSAAPICARNGNITGVVLVFRDVTEEYRIHKELEESEGKYRRLIEGIGPRYCVISQTPEGTFTFASKNFERLFGVAAQSVIGKTWSAIKMPQEVVRAGKDADKRLLNQNVFQRMEMTVMHPDNQQKIIELYFGPVFENGVLTRIEGICTDITDQKKSEEMLLRTQKLDSLGTLAGGIAHDFNNLLAGIYGYITLAHDSSLEADVKGYLSKTLETIDRTRSLTNQLLTFAKGGGPQKTTASLIPLLPDTVRFALSGSTISCEFNIADNLWLCEFDQNQISQVIDNLVINAKQAMPSGGSINITAENVIISEKNKGIIPEGKWVKIAVIDYGTGISPEHLTRIFDPFFTTKSKGHGLGLATSHSIISRHGGYMQADSLVNHGTTFSIYLPVSENRITSRIENAIPETGGCGTILLLDDEDFMLTTTSAILESAGYNTICKHCGEEVIDYLNNDENHAENIAGMIFDLTIPGKMGGREIIDAVRKSFPSVPVFVVSGYADDPVIANPTDYGFTASLGKPYRKHELLGMLSRYIPCCSRK